MTAPGPHAFTQGNATDNYASKARTIFSDIDIDYKEYLTDQSPSVMSTVKEVLDELLWKYMSVFMAQPFEVAKTIMQVRAQDDLGGLEALAMEQAKTKAAANPKIRMYDEVCFYTEKGHASQYPRSVRIANNNETTRTHHPPTTPTRTKMKWPPSSQPRRPLTGQPRHQQVAQEEEDREIRAPAAATHRRREGASPANKSLNTNSQCARPIPCWK